LRAAAINPVYRELAAATGHVLLHAGDHAGARDTLTAALAQSAPTPRRQRVLILIDLATAELRSGNFPAACSQPPRPRISSTRPRTQSAPPACAPSALPHSGS
jgi:hypothetical protein